MNPQDEALSVTQADRDFARDWNIECKHCSEYDGDFEADLASAVAAHRLSHSTPGDAEVVIAELRKKYLIGARDVGLGRKERGRCSHYVQVLDELTDRLATPSGRAQAWLPIETAPHDKPVLLGWHDWRDGKWIMNVGPYSTGERYSSGFSSMSCHGSATHWQPLPAAPPAQDQAKGDE